jgi:hypothetical protein
MTDFSKYKNVTKLKKDIKLSRSQVVKTLVNEKARMLNGKLSK